MTYVLSFRAQAVGGAVIDPYLMVGDDPADPPVAVDAERLVAKRCPDAGLPAAGLQRRHLLGDLAHRGKHQPPGQLGGGVGG